MTREEAIRMLTNIRDEANESESGLCYVSNDEGVVALDLAIEALKEPTGDYEFFGGEYEKEDYAESETTTDFISRQQAIEAVKNICNTPCNEYFVKAIESLPSFTPKVSEDCISRQQAVEALTGWETDPSDEDIVRQLNALPQVTPTEQTDFTDFINWLLGEVLDEENWELNAVADGEIICRKLKKLDLYCGNCGAKMGGEE